MLTGCTPPEDTGWPTSTATPPAVTRRTEIWLLPASAASRYLPSGVAWIAPWEARPKPRPAPPAPNGDPRSGVTEPSARRANPSMVLAVAVLPSM